jgi:hypothetical protein
MSDARFRDRGIQQAVADRVDQAGSAGISMGALVDALVADGATETESEQAIWGLMQARRLTPNGYVRRVIRRREGDHQHEHRTYEFVLVAWTPDQDRQLDLDIDEDRGR